MFCDLIPSLGANFETLYSELPTKLSPTFMCTFQAGDHVNVENYEGGIKILHRSRSMIGMS